MINHGKTLIDHGKTLINHGKSMLILSKWKDLTSKQAVKHSVWNLGQNQQSVWIKKSIENNMISLVHVVFKFWIHTSTYTYINTHTYMHITSTYTHITSTYTHINISIYTHIHTHIHHFIRIYTHIHMRI